MPQNYEIYNHNLLHNPDNASPYNILENLISGRLSGLIIDQTDFLSIDTVRNIRFAREAGKPIAIIMDSEDHEIQDSEIAMFTSLSGIKTVTQLPGIKSNPDIKYLPNVFFANKSTAENYSINRPFSPYWDYTEKVNISSEKYSLPDKLSAMVSGYQKSGKRVVIVTGVFDVLHAGHVDFFNTAKSYGDVLIVLINSDYSASMQPKNSLQDRPVNPLTDRVEVLDCLTAVDHVIGFDSITAISLLQDLHGVTYVKTEKDSSPGVKKEQEIISNNGGINVVLPALTVPSGQEIQSSTSVINIRRSKASDNGVYVDIIPTALEDISRSLIKENFGTEFDLVSPVYDRIFDSILAELVRINSKKGIFTALRKESDLLLNNSPEQALLLQESLIRRSYDFYMQEIFPTHSDRGNIYKTIFLNTMLQLIGVHCEIIPLQYVEDDTMFGKTIAIKMIDSSLMFIDVSRKSIHDPIKFSEYYLKHLPQHTSFQLRDGKKYFARRIYAEPKNQHTTAIAISLLTEYLYLIPAARDDIISLFRKTMTDFGYKQEKNHDTPEQPNIVEINKNKVKPKIVAHGGAAVLGIDPWAENSRSGIIAASQKGVDVIEIDIVPTKDKNWIVSHYTDLSRLTAKTGQTTDYLLSQLEKTEFINRDGKPTGETIIGLAEALSIIKNGNSEVKIDIKIKNPGKADFSKIIRDIKSSGIPSSKCMVTCGDAGISRTMHLLDKELRIELNTVEITNFLLANDLMRDDLMIELFLDYVKNYSRQTGSATVSLMQVSLNTWGKKTSSKIVNEIHSLGKLIQVWVVQKTDEYISDWNLGIDYVLMHRPELIDQCMKIKPEEIDP